MASERPENEHVFERLLADLREGDLLIRLGAAEALGERGDPRAVEPLIAALADPDWHVCEVAVNALGRLSDERAIEPLIQALTRRDIRFDLSRACLIAAAVCAALPHLGEGGFQSLLCVLRDFVGDECIGGAAAITLGEMRDPRALDVLLLALASHVHEVGQAAAQALYALGEIAWHPLLAMLRDEQSPYGSFHATRILSLSGAPVVPLLIEALQTSDSPLVRSSVAEAIGNIQDDRAREPLRQAVHDTDDDVRLQAACALAALSDADAVPPLLAALVDADERDANSIINSLQDVGEPAVPSLLELLRDVSASPTARCHAIAALTRLKARSAIGALVDTLADAHAEVRAATAQALGDLGAAEAADMLLKLTEDTDPSVRLSAYSGLAGLHDSRAIPGLLQFAQEDVGIPGADPVRWRLRTRAVIAMVRLGRQAIEPLRQLLTGADHLISHHAATMLAMLGEDGRAALLEETRNPQPEVRRTALTFLFRLADRDAPAPRDREALLAALADHDVSMRRVGAGGLRYAATAQDIEPLVKALEDDDIFVRFEVACALERVGDERAITPLFRAYNAIAETDHMGMTARDTLMRAVISIKRRQRGADG